MERYDTLFWKAFVAFFGGLMMIFSFDLLPLVVIFTSVRSTIPSSVIHVLGATGLAIFGFTPIAIIIALGAVFFANVVDDIKLRAERLLKIVAKGNDMMFFWNLVGIAFLLLCLARYAFCTLSPPDEGFINGD